MVTKVTPVPTRDKQHIFISKQPTNTKFTSRRSGGSRDDPTFVGNRRTHVDDLKTAYDAAIKEQLSQDPKIPGSRLTFQARPGVDLAIKSLESTKKNHPKVLASKTILMPDGQSQTQTTIFIPKGQKQFLLKKLDSYAASLGEDKPKNLKLVEGIQSLRSATIKDLWTDPDADYPESREREVWWEVWLVDSKKRTLERFSRFVKNHLLRSSNGCIGFANRAITLLHISVENLSRANEIIDIIAELRKPREIAGFMMRQSAQEQADWANDLLSRVTWPDEEAPRVCILDRGVQSSHILVGGALNNNDVMTAKNGWNSNDLNWDPKPPSYARAEDAHGTEMAGIAIYGNLEETVASREMIELHHRLESVRILPRKGNNLPELYARVSANAVNVAEKHTVTSETANRCFMMAVTSNGEIASNDSQHRNDVGRPSSWSAAIDELSYGHFAKTINTKEDLSVFDRESKLLHPRLFIISAGNIRDLNAEDDYKDRCDLEPVQSPSQSWNALTVGAYADRDSMENAPEGFDGYTPIASKGDLSPSSRTSVLFDRKKWPIKPDVVAPGGNWAVSQTHDSVDSPDNLGVLTTRHKAMGTGYFTVSRDTSAATAYVAYIAGEIQARYPGMLPQTVRGLIVHSAQWTAPMKKQFEQDSDLALRRFGMGVPDLERAIYSASNAASMVAESKIHPFKKSNSTNSMGDINYHKLPWPTEALEQLGNKEVVMRTTLSYFIEPNPGSRGWNGRYSYQSFGLRMSQQRLNESLEAFKARLNKNERDDESGDSIGRDSARYVLSDEQENGPGSIRTSIWKGPAIDLANCSTLAVYPTGGWWKESVQQDQSDRGVDYSLIISIETEDTNVDLWTPINVANTVKVPVPITVPGI